MRELELAVDPPIDPGPARARAPRVFPLSRAAFVVSLVVHVLAGYALSRHAWPDSPPPPPPPPISSCSRCRRPRRAPRSHLRPSPRSRCPSSRAAASPSPHRRATGAEPTSLSSCRRRRARAATEPATTPQPALIDFDEERRRAANQVIGLARRERVPDVLDRRRGSAAAGRRARAAAQHLRRPGRPARPDRRSARASAHEVRPPRELALQRADGRFLVDGIRQLLRRAARREPSGLFPEVRPAYLDLMPECVDTRDTAPALALEAPFSTVKCRLVKQEDSGRTLSFLFACKEFAARPY